MPNEYEDLESFLRQRHKKKQQEKEERWQPKITNFFTLIKQEPDYDGDDERGFSVMPPAQPPWTPVTARNQRKSPKPRNSAKNS